MIKRYTSKEMGAIWSDEAKMDAWKDVEIAACEGWTKQGVIPPEEMEKIRKGTFTLERVAEIEKITDHDTASFVEAFGESLGDEARWVHLGMTSSDVVDTGLALQLVRAVDLLIKDVEDLSAVLERQALAYKDTPTIGRTHGVHAEPTTFGLKLLIWVEEMRRNLVRLRAARTVVAVGKISGAVGTHANVPPEVEEHACLALGITAAAVSNQIVQRDRHAEFVCSIAIVGASLDKMATEIRHLQRTEVFEAEEPFEEGRQGSSAMPHKRNPARCERVCGLARVLRGYAVAALENVALWHERDISNSSVERVILPDACCALDYMLRLFTGVMEGLRVLPERMRQNLDLTQGLLNSQRVLLALIEAGMSRTDAYKIVQRHAMAAWEASIDFQELLLGDDDVRQRLSAEEVAALFDESYHFAHVDTAFRRVSLLS